MNMHCDKKKMFESGAIMLEVVAVLSLMGLMGVMLFRQIYLRNQELYNIQMAAEIRVVKEGFAAWIQAESTKLAQYCSVGPSLDDVNVCSMSAITGADPIAEIKDFLPEGYFTDEEARWKDRGEVLRDNYRLYLIGYRRGTAEAPILTYYGVVLPSPDILPEEGMGSSWNFRRAARVATLIGVDGGAYDQNVTGNEIAGAMGTWHLPIGGLIDDPDEQKIPTYAAITGIDIFQPEVDLPTLKIGLPDPWDLALQNATAYGHFSAGGADNCYAFPAGGRQVDVQMQDGALARLTSDTVNAPASGNNCRPAFYVKSGHDGTNATGDVYVLNDLRVGHDYGMGTSKMRFDKGGMIVFEQDEEADPQNPGKKVNYMLDPKYTSVMNDIKIMSRGGARLSDILPNYILKGQEKRVCSLRTNFAQCTNATTPAWGTAEQSLDVSVTCPSQYKAAVVVIPVMVGVNFLAPQSVGGALVTTESAPAGSDNHTHAVSFANRRFAITLSESPSQDYVKGVATDSSTQTKEFHLQMGYQDAGGTPVKPFYNENVEVIIQTYCVFDPNNIDWNSDGTVDAADHNPTKDRPMDDTACGRIKDPTVCANMVGCAWNGSVCKASSPSP